MVIFKKNKKIKQKFKIMKKNKFLKGFFLLNSGWAVIKSDIKFEKF